MNITEQNWTSSHFYSHPLRAFVSLGAAPKETAMGTTEVEFQYLVTMTDTDYNELYQSIHNNLEDALANLNQKYGHWELKDAGAKAAGDGCSSCAAH